MLNVLNDPRLWQRRSAGGVKVLEYVSMYCERALAARSEMSQAQVLFVSFEVMFRSERILEGLVARSSIERGSNQIS